MQTFNHRSKSSGSLNIHKLRTSVHWIEGAVGNEDHDPKRPPHHKTRDYGSLESVAHGAYGGALEFEGDLDFPINPDIAGFLRGLDEEVAANGIDALAWYSSFHFPSEWGIFLPIRSLLYIEVRHFHDLPITRREKWNLAYNIIIEHELFHFLADVACARWETILHAPCWKAKHQLLKTSPASYLEIEEALANAFSFEQNKTAWPAEVRTAVRRFMAHQPPGYRDWKKYSSGTNFRFGLRDLVRNHIGAHACERHVSLDPEVVDPTALWPGHDALVTTQCPLTLLWDSRDNWLIPNLAPRFITAIPAVIEGERFRRQLTGLHPSLRQRWSRKREELKYRIPRFPEFEKLKGSLSGLFSLRLNDNFRVHLKPQPDYSNWEAVEVGTHKELGHG